MQLIRRCSDTFRPLIGSISVVLSVYRIMNRSVSLKFNEYIRETAVIVAINMVDIRFSLILFYILCSFSSRHVFDKNRNSA